jgi:uncharacterized membrane protein
MSSTQPAAKPSPVPTLERVFRFFARNFARGLLFVAPVAATIWILIYVFEFINGLITVPTEGDWKFTWLGIDFDAHMLAFRGAGFVIAITGIVVVGMLTGNVLTRWALRRVDQLFTHVPVVKLIYSAIKDMIEAFVSEEKKFDKPVLLSFAETPDVEVIGFVTREDLSEFGRPGKVAVYVPQSYNFAANLILVPRQRVTPIDLPSGEVMTFVVSGGVSQATQGK